MKIAPATFKIEEDIDAQTTLKNIEKYGRVCYKSESKITESSANDFIRMIIKSGHESVLEHEKISVRFFCDRGITHEIVRHRIASYSQESTRYCNYSKDGFSNQITVINPCFWDNHKNGSKEKLKVWKAAMEYAETAYLELIKLGATAQEARAVLPNSLKSEIIVTMNLREWRHFFKLRTTVNAHPQMREIAIPLLSEFKSLLPPVFYDIEPYIDSAHPKTKGVSP
jgi:thymidylate synthase (FAD)